MATPPGFDKVREGRDEPIVEPDIPILDAHHHLFHRPHFRYMLDDYLDDVNAGHKIVGSVYIESQSFVRRDGPQELRPVGEVEFANGVGAIARSGFYGPCRVATAIVAYADLSSGDRVAATLDAALSVAPDRLRGVRQIALSHPNEAVLRFVTHRPHPDLMKSDGFRAALGHLAPRGLSFDATVLHYQLPELAQIAREFRETTIVLDHLGLAFAADVRPDGRADVFKEWRKNMQEIAQNPNVFCKVGGLGTSYWGFRFNERTDPIGYRELASTWKPYVESAIEAFGAERCMMESDFPNDGRSCGFVPLWNALKFIVKDYAAEEKRALFCATAQKVYRIELP